ncbi:hypothetical protein [Hymenobacter sp. CRA2]|uniref:hypothetical protein n=1 Tax=Hymenobacter sp. CRA2 TaxID=1955620 RepID=UPI00098E9E3A|nr:hypothetical protein [Hymenobacter sp. CRA2]OON69036.1 hypothetical protein B0919_10000 [Hymenobacter sp. CRA2]
MQKDSNHQVHLDATANFLSGDLQEGAARASLDNRLQNWIEDLKVAHNPELHDLITDLQALKAHFGGGAIDHKLVGQLLHRLGVNTQKAAHFAQESGIQSRIENLGQALLEAAKQVAGGRTSAEDDLRQDSANRKNA